MTGLAKLSTRAAGKRQYVTWSFQEAEDFAALFGGVIIEGSAMCRICYFILV